MIFTTIRHLRSTFYLKYKIGFFRFSNNHLNRFWPTINKQIDLYNLKFYKPFFRLRNLKKNSDKFRYILKNVISEPLFLFYTYKDIINNSNRATMFKINNKITCKHIKFDWFLRNSKKLKNNRFNLKFNYLFNKSIKIKRLDANFSENKLVQQAIYLTLMRIYKYKLKYFPKHPYHDQFNVSYYHYSILNKIKLTWTSVNWCIKFNFRKYVSFFKKKALINIIQKEIQDQSLLSMLYKIFKKKEIIFNSPLLQLLRSMYFSPFYKHIWNFIKTFNLKKEKFVNNEISSEIRYIGYPDNFILGIVGKKELALEIKKKITNYIETNFFLNTNKNTIKLVNIFNNSIGFFIL